MADEKELELPVAEVESVVGSDTKVRVRLKGQRPENKFLLQFESTTELIEVIHDAKKRGGTVWVRFKTNANELKDAELVVRDFLE